jgi:hypothetical protein
VVLHLFFLSRLEFTWLVRVVDSGRCFRAWAGIPGSGNRAGTRRFEDFESNCGGVATASDNYLGALLFSLLTLILHLCGKHPSGLSLKGLRRSRPSDHFYEHRADIGGFCHFSKKSDSAAVNSVA